MLKKIRSYLDRIFYETCIKEESRQEECEIVVESIFQSQEEVDELLDAVYEVNRSKSKY